jgi:hypothetical protein
MDGQDWNPVTIKRQDGGGCVGCIVPRSQGGPRTAGAVRAAKLEAGETVVRKFLSTESVAAVQAYRRANQLTQKDLDQRLSWPANTTNAIEGRRVAPTSHQLQQLTNLTRTALKLSV